MSRPSALLISIIALLLLAGCSTQDAKGGSDSAANEPSSIDGASSVNDENGAVYLTNCRVIDGTGAAPVTNAVVVFEEGIIMAIGASDSIAIPKGAKVIDLSGATVMPGFINAHVHDAYNEQNLETWLRAGVTTVRDESPRVVDFLAQRDRLNEELAHARIVSATPILTVPDGYGHVYFTSAATASEVVSEYIADGAEIVKISIEDDLQGRTWEMPTYEMVKAIVDTAHNGGCKVSVHISHERNLQWAIDAGVDDISHMVVEPVSKETAERMVQKGIYWVPTLELWNGVSEKHRLKWIDVAVERPIHLL